MDQFQSFPGLLSKTRKARRELPFLGRIRDVWMVPTDVGNPFLWKR